MKWQRALGMVVVSATVAAIATGTGQQERRADAASFPQDLVWLALGDSYSSGEGLRYTDSAANPPGKSCERATGSSTVNNGRGSQAYGAVAYDKLRGQMVTSTFRLVACTGARSNEIHDQWREWKAVDGRQADLVTVSMGGNNIGFKDAIFGCVGVSWETGFSVAAQAAPGVGVGGNAVLTLLNPAVGCTISESEFRRRIDLLVGDSGVGPDGGQTLVDMYRELAHQTMTPGGHVVILGYPNLVEESGRWVLWLLEGNRCSRIRRADVAMLRSVAGYFNEQLANLSARLDAEQPNGVRFHWVDVSQIYESENGGRHGLCTGDPWLNGMTLGWLGPDTGRVPVRMFRSFHPNQRGHDAVGARVAEVVAGLDWGGLRRPASDPAPPPPAEALRTVWVPSLCGHAPGTLVDGELPIPADAGGSDPGHVTLGDLIAVGDVDGDGREEIAAVFSCNQGGVGWPEHVLVYRDDYTYLGDVDTGRAFTDFDVWRSVVEQLEYTDGTFQATVHLESSAIEPTERRLLVIDVVDGNIALAAQGPPRDDLCTESRIRDDLAASTGGDAFILEGLCTEGWAYVGTCRGECGDHQLIARVLDGTWTVVTRFPTTLCRSDLLDVGAPTAVVDRVTWQCEVSSGGVLREGSRGEAVSELQRALVARGYDVEVDGQFGPGTDAAVRAFQQDAGLTPDGLIGPATKAALGIGGG